MSGFKAGDYVQIVKLDTTPAVYGYKEMCQARGVYSRLYEDDLLKVGEVYIIYTAHIRSEVPNDPYLLRIDAEFLPCVAPHELRKLSPKEIETYETMRNLG